MCPIDRMLDVGDLSVRVGQKLVLANLQMQVSRGDCIGLVGESGSGKSMTCRAICGQLERVNGRIVSGRLIFEGTDLVGLSERRWRPLRGRGIALMPQNSTSALNPVMRVGPQLRETVRQLDPGSDTSRRIQELLELVHLQGTKRVLRAYPHELSGGMRQRVMLALALAGRPKLLLADEPTTALDVSVQRQILDLVAELRRATQLTVVFVSHDLGVVATVADQIAVMYAGTVVETGPTESVLEQPQHPYTRALIAAGQALDNEQSRLETIPGNPRALDESLGGCQFEPRCPIARPECRTRVPQLLPRNANRQVACFAVEAKT